VGSSGSISLNGLGSVTLKVVPTVRPFLGGLIPRERYGDSDTVAQASRVLAFCLSMLIWVPVFAMLYTALGAPLCSNVILSGGALLLGIVMLLKRGVPAEACGNMLTAAVWYVYTAIACLTGGIWSPVMIWFATVPILSVLLCGNRPGVFWTIASGTTISAFALAEWQAWFLPTELPPEGFLIIQYSGMVGLMLCVYLLVSVLKRMEFGARQALREANSKLELQAATDGLTGIPNRHRFDTALEQEWARHRRTGLPLSIALIDADFFKDFNDEYGHLAGDECLRTVARAIRASVRRPNDFCARFGGEEFVVILPNTDEVGAKRVAELIRAHVRTLAIPHALSTVSPYVTVSIGLSTTIPEADRSHLDFLHDVDMALYRAKEAGRDCVVQVDSATLQPVA
jgi:diguanylate cyclase (GGDEF)-like protein